mmetsp:Transcript_2869/g.7109  ORF Transcript_2869/g.7109 Transcript_2869/m.7109 type:complete len:296 (-) Transcript_2869:27-914(-)
MHHAAHAHDDAPPSRQAGQTAQHRGHHAVRGHAVGVKAAKAGVTSGPALDVGRDLDSSLDEDRLQRLQQPLHVMLHQYGAVSRLPPCQAEQLVVRRLHHGRRDCVRLGHQDAHQALDRAELHLLLAALHVSQCALHGFAELEGEDGPATRGGDNGAQNVGRCRGDKAVHRRGVGLLADAGHVIARGAVRALLGMLLQHMHAEVEHVVDGAALHHGAGEQRRHARGGHPLPEPHHLRLQRRQDVECAHRVVAQPHRRHAARDGADLVAHQKVAGSLDDVLQQARAIEGPAAGKLPQ